MFNGSYLWISLWEKYCFQPSLSCFTSYYQDSISSLYCYVALPRFQSELYCSTTQILVFIALLLPPDSSLNQAFILARFQSLLRCFSTQIIVFIILIPYPDSVSVVCIILFYGTTQILVFIALFPCAQILVFIALLFYPDSSLYYSDPLPRFQSVLYCWSKSCLQYTMCLSLCFVYNVSKSCVYYTICPSLVWSIRFVQVLYVVYNVFASLPQSLFD